MRFLPLLLAALLAAPAGAQDVVSVDPEDPVRGEPVTVMFDAAADSVMVTYRPGAVTATTVTFTPGADTFTFTPEQAGVVQVAAAGGATQSLSVRFVSAPLSGIVVMLLAGLILFGGASIALRALLEDGHAIEIDPTLRPDT